MIEEEFVCDKFIGKIIYKLFYRFKSGEYVIYQLDKEQSLIDVTPEYLVGTYNNEKEAKKVLDNLK